MVRRSVRNGHVERAAHRCNQMRPPQGRSQMASARSAAAASAALHRARARADTLARRDPRHPARPPARPPAAPPARQPPRRRRRFWTVLHLQVLRLFDAAHQARCAAQAAARKARTSRAAAARCVRFEPSSSLPLAGSGGWRWGSSKRVEQAPLFTIAQGTGATSVPLLRHPSPGFGSLAASGIACAPWTGSGAVGGGGVAGVSSATPAGAILFAAAG